jgi:hypothetical protein
MWAFFLPLNPAAWIWMASAVLLVPLLVVTLELVLKARYGPAAWPLRGPCLQTPRDRAPSSAAARQFLLQRAV